MSLFRPEAVEAKYGNWLGTSVLPAPFPLAIATVAALACALSLVLTGIFGHYTKRVQANGTLVPDLGILKVQSRYPGIVVERRVREGQLVHRGDVLFVLSDDRLANRTTPKQRSQIAPEAAESVVAGQALLDNLGDRIKSARDEGFDQVALGKQREAQARRQAANLSNEIAQVDKEVAVQIARLRSSEEQYRRQADLVSKNFISEAGLSTARNEMLDQQGRLESLQRSRLALLRDHDSAQDNISQYGTAARKDIKQLERNVDELKHQLLAAEFQNSIVIVAPQDGVVTNLLISVGQLATTQTLLTLVPSNSALEAHVYLPSSSAGFVETGQKVNVRFAAFPYQRFGQYHGTVKEVARSGLSSGDLPDDLIMPIGHSASEKLYRVRIELEHQYVTAYGRQQLLSSGSQFDVDILVERRRIVDWILDPVYRLKGWF